MLKHFERDCDAHGRNQPQENRPGIGRQLFHNLLKKQLLLLALTYWRIRTDSWEKKSFTAKMMIILIMLTKY